mgnify:CR=1 FL=1
MHIISRKQIKEFWEKHPTSETSLRNWFKTANSTDFHTFAQLKESFGSVDEVDGFHVFNIGGNKTRLIAKISFQYQKIYIHSVLTHAEYSKGKWKL